MDLGTVSEGFRTILVAALAIASGYTWLGVRAAMIPVAAPERLIAELRLSQIGALLLSLIAGAYIGFAATHENRPGTGLEVALALGFLIAAASTLIQDPRHALTVLALAFAVHAIADVAPRPGGVPDAIAPRWYALGCAVFDVYLGAVTYWPMLKR